MSEIGHALESVYEIVKDRQASPKEGSYTNYLLREGVDKICKKVGEEATEVVIAAKNRKPSELIYEVSDLLYHLNVLLAEQGVGWPEIAAELKSRRSK